ncbi:response regulator transcription factor [Aneurinibacillus terranovensis]|uniref:response regulator transcription factor n=1 Tax=Aneurinibacillus terranovensis TaxID=278991 RepID=UPI0003F93C1E|nr:response regulator transcription factor [Aneurinibacillus terranovensis]
MNTKGKTILIVEDDAKIRQLIHIYLDKAGYDVCEAADGVEGQESFRQYDPCFVIIDLMLPRLSGESLCCWIRNEMKSDVPIIMVTAKVSEEDRIKGLQMGADDYIIKPFSPQELVVRVETVLRRTVHRCSKISYRGLTIKPMRGEVHYNGTVIPLTHNEFCILYFLMRHPNQILTREQILEEIDPLMEKVSSKRSIDVHVGNVRAKLGKAASSTSFIETIRGMGYRFAAF